MCIQSHHHYHKVDYTDIPRQFIIFSLFLQQHNYMINSNNVWPLTTIVTSNSLAFNSLRPSDAYMRRKLIIIGSDNGLSPGRRQAIIWTNAAILLNGPLGTNFSKILIDIQKFSFKKMHLEMSSAKWRPFRLGLNVLKLDNIINEFKLLWKH